MKPTDQQRFEQAIGKAISDRHAQSPAAREKIYAAARAALASRSGGAPGLAGTLESAIAAIESSFAPEPELESAAALSLPGAAKPRYSRIGQGVPRPPFAFVAGAVVGALLATLAVVLVNSAADQPASAGQALEAKYARSLQQLPVAEAFLTEVSDAVIEMQKKDRAALEAKAGKKFVSLKQLDPALARKMPKSLPPGSAMIVRATGRDFKILFNWTLCAAASIARPELVDRVRSRTDMLGCPYFGIWTQGAANW
jgi:hypothetical protein